MNRRSFLATSLFASSAVVSTNLIARNLAPSARLQSAPDPSQWSNHTITSCWIGHSTILLNVFGTIILTDPVLGSTAGVHVLGQTIGIPRLAAPAIALHDIPKPDIVLLSHAHMDHTDIFTLEFLATKYPNTINCICAKNTKDIVDTMPWRTCKELDWWDSLSFGDLSISAIEVLHNGWRYPWEADRREGYTRSGRSYNGYLISSHGTNIVFGGDTAFTEAWRDLRSVPIHLAFMPIGAYAGFTDNHCTPEQAVQMASIIEAHAVAPIHCHTFKQSAEPMNEPMKRFQAALNNHQHLCAWSHIGQTHSLKT